MNVLVVGAHPDDSELCCFGTLARCVDRGDSVVVCSVTNGNQGHATIEPERLRMVRMAESAKAAAVIGASYCTLDVDDMELDATDKTVRLRMTELIRSVKPDLVITHDPDDYHPDHNATSELVMYCLVQATLTHCKTESPAIDKIMHLYHMDKVGGGVFTPTEFVDISDTYEKKEKALACHASQIDYLEKRGHLHLMHAMKVLAEFRGIQSGCRFAEGFRPSSRRPVPTRRMFP
jgi:LmbE family N-acetylglucosaminyl deacetylase